MSVTRSAASRWATASTRCPARSCLGPSFDSGCHFVYQSPTELQEIFLEEFLATSAQTDAALIEASHEAGLQIESSGVLAGDAIEGAEDDEWADWCGALLRSCAGDEQPKKLELPSAMAMQWLVEAHIRYSELRG